MKRRKEEDKEEEEKIQLSKTAKVLVSLIACIAIFGRLPPLATGILFGFMPIVVTFDVVRQRLAQKEG